MPIITELSPLAGENNDGFADCVVNESLLAGVLVNSIVAPVAYIYALDVDTNGNAQYKNLSDAISNKTSTEVFGVISTMSAGDELYIACDHRAKGVWLDVVAGVGNWGILECFGGADFTTPLPISDGTNAFKTSGWQYIEFTSLGNDTEITPSRGIEKRRWNMFKIKDFVSVTTAPKVKGAYIIHADSAITWRDKTSERNASMTDGVFAESTSESFHAVGGVQVYVCDTLPLGFNFAVHRKYSQVINRTIQYLASDGTLKDFTYILDPSNNWMNGPTNLGDPIQTFKAKWSTPTDFQSSTKTFTLNDGTTKTYTDKYFIYYTITSIPSLGPTLSALTRARVRQFGNDNVRGQRIFGAKTLKGVSILTITNENALDMSCEVVNLSTGKATAFTIPANPTLPFNIDVTDLSFADGDIRGMRCISGGSAIGVQLEYAY